MRFILNTIFIILLSLFYSNFFIDSFVLFADEEGSSLEIKEQIINSVSSFIKENYQYPSQRDISNLLGVNNKEIKSIFGSIDNFYESLFNYDTEGNILKIVLESSSSLECYKNERLRAALQKEFIKRYIYPWMEKNKKFLTRNFTVPEEVNIYYNGMFDEKNQKGLFNSLYDLIEKTIEFDSEEKYLKYIFSSDLYETLCNNQDIKEKLQKVFIEQCLFSWMKKKVESSEDKYMELIVENITIFSRNLWGILFNTKLELMNQIIKYDTDQKYVKYILRFRFSVSDYYNPEIRTILQKIFIVNYLFPWMDVNPGLPTISDFTEGSNSIDISYHKIFGGPYNIGIFDSFADFMKVFIKIDEKEQYLKNILTYDFPKDCYEDLYVRGVLQTLFVKNYLCPWLDKSNRLPAPKDFDVNGIGLEYSKIFYSNMQIRMFYSTQEILQKLEEIDVDGKYKKYIEEFNCKAIFSKSKKKKNQEDDL